MLKIDIHKSFVTKNRQFDVNCSATFKLGETTALYGRSGMGKTTIIRMIAGLDTPDKGTICLNKELWFSNELKIEVPTKKRSVGMVFQDFNLFKNMSIEANLKYASDGPISKEINSLSEQMGVRDLFSSYPNQLSGGQKQRVAILRSLCQENKVLLLDEPFSALDDETIIELIDAITKIKNHLGVAIIVVTHRKDVIFKMADSVVKLDSTNSAQGKPSDLLEKNF